MPRISSSSCGGPVLAARAVEGDERHVGSLRLRAAATRSAPTSSETDLVRRARRARPRPAPQSAARPVARATCRPSAPRPSSPVLAASRRSGTTSARPQAPAVAASDGRLSSRCSPVIVSYRATCSPTTLPIRRMPSRISSSVGAGEVEPHRAACHASVDERRGPGHEGDVLAQRLREQIRRVDVGRAASPRRTVPRSGRVQLPAPESGARAPRASRRGESDRRRRGCRCRRASDPRRSTRGRSTGRGSRCRGRSPASRARSSPSPAAGPPPSPGGFPARGSWTGCRRRSRSRRRRAGRAAAAARPRSAAVRRGCPRPPAPRARAASSTSRLRRSAESVTPAGF